MVSLYLVRKCFGWVFRSSSGVRSFLLSKMLPKSYPDLQPLYDAARSYLEIPQRINLLNTRVEVGLHKMRVLALAANSLDQVLQDMLQLLKESVSSKHAERLEQIVIVLIAIEIGPESAKKKSSLLTYALLVLGLITIVVDLKA